VTSSQILNHQPTTLSGVGPRETSFWLLAMTSGDEIFDLNFRSIPWPIEYLSLLVIFSIQEGTICNGLLLIIDRMINKLVV